MTQLSRPLQVALAGVALLAVVWFFALRGHSSSSESTSTASPPATASASAASASSSPGGSAGVYHGSAPGVEGLTRAIQKARGAVAQSEQNAAQLEQKSAQASGEAAAPAASSASGVRASTPASATHHAGSVHWRTAHRATHAAATHAATHAAATHAGTHAAATHTASSSRSHVPAGQVWVEHELKQKLTVALLFYSAHAFDDSRTRREAERLVGDEHARHVRIALRVAPASAVGSYGSFTHVASIYETPTLLIVRPNGEVKPPVTGLTDAFSLEQAIDEKTQP